MSDQKLKPEAIAGGCEPVHAGDITQKEADLHILPSHGISLDVPGDTNSGRPPIIQHLSTPAYQSPLRHHRRTPSQHREVKETLNARSEYTNNEDDGKAEHHINQYIIKDEIGRGSFGAVHLAVDQYGTEYAVKEFSKSRLRKRAQSNILRRPHGYRRPGHLAAGMGFNSPLHRHSASDIHDNEEAGNPLYLIKEEIAIMKKLNHPNLVSLIEVLDDPEEDSLYMVLEMCKKGVVMKVGLNEQSDPYSIEQCRHWFRDLILGIEYLHAQGVVHRDIKPDNLLLTEDDVLKIVDFGVSEMFEKASDMMTAKSAGSPAFLPPELCVTKHGHISGKAADIWSMGVSLYCLRFGHIPFERTGVLELYECIKSDEPKIEADDEPEFCDLMRKLLEKDPAKRIKMSEVRKHPWVTKKGTDPLLSEEENIADLVEPPSEVEVNHAITAKMRNLIVLVREAISTSESLIDRFSTNTSKMKAVQKFKSKLDTKRPAALSGVLGQGIRTLTTATMDGHSDHGLHRSKSADLEDRRPIETALAAEGVHHDLDPPDVNQLRPMPNRLDSTTTIIQSEHSSPTSTLKKQSTDDVSSSEPPVPGILRQESGERGHAHDPLDEQPLFLGIGAGGDDTLSPPSPDIVAESPTAAEFNIYDTAYQKEVERIRSAQGHQATVYLTRRVDKKKEYKADQNMINAPNAEEVKESLPHQGFKGLLDKAREKSENGHEEAQDAIKERLSMMGMGSGSRFSDIANRAMENTKVLGRQLHNRSEETLDGFFGKGAEKK
ncbi:BcCMK3, calcium/calmodulin-dependent protein kinase [Mollisia scopiformis]|uniref:BcCMK3, calcium/calmodulin-dependent protein kinase n=1 Tax=Mollisia scopiformis TaxID=149040 RepID=A0A194XI21_MOLSC|nr:BcCMK3, calcium/calmodulin-dependent protein kinase [Mollisia scopiformis]KUJ19870.1 BcCMK3, calcium/calmodulin-dependent protein kinase [Mollisia scopiformis]